MLKMEIELDGAKLLAMGYDTVKVFAALDKTFSDRNIRSIAAGTSRRVYADSGRPQDFSNIWAVALMLRKQRWFVEAVTLWLWYNSDDADDPNDFAVEDLIDNFIRGGIKIVG